MKKKILNVKIVEILRMLTHETGGVPNNQKTPVIQFLAPQGARRGLGILQVSICRIQSNPSIGSVIVFECVAVPPPCVMLFLKIK